MRWLGYIEDFVLIRIMTQLYDVFSFVLIHIGIKETNMIKNTLC